MRVRVYYHFRKKCFSIQALEGENKGRVIGYTNNISLTEVTFNVQPKGNARVRREKKKNVHAAVFGKITTTKENLNTQVRYDPYEMTTFEKLDGTPIYKADNINMINGKMFI